jgi:hypothetical protein
MAQDPNMFAADSKGNLLSSLPTVALKLAACERICGTTWTTYPDAGPRLMTWLVPVLVLTANLHYSAIGRGKFLTVLHLLGDPIGSTWSLLSKVETWRQRYKGGEGRSRNAAVVAAGIEELLETFDTDFDDAQVQLILQDMLVRPNIEPVDLDHPAGKAASELVDCRVNQTVRTWASIILYLVQVIAAFVPKLGQASSPSGGRIGAAVLFSWLLPIVLLSNAAGDFTSRRTFLRIMMTLMEHVERQGGWGLSKPSRDLLHALRQVDERYFKSLAWSGAICTHRRWNRLHSRSTVNGWSAPFLSLISTVPVILAFVTAFSVLYTEPTYFNCRLFLVVSVFAAWLLSPLLTWKIGTHFSPKRQWYLVLGKDALIAFPIVALIIGSSCGLFNSCWCWSGAYTLGLGNAAVYLTDLPQFVRYTHVNYPAIVGTCLGLQVGVFVLIRWTYWRRAFSLFNRSEKEKEAAFLGELLRRTRGEQIPESFDKDYFSWDRTYV